MRKETINKMAIELGYTMTMNKSYVYLSNNKGTVHKRGFDRAYNFLYGKYRTKLNKLKRELIWMYFIKNSKGEYLTRRNFSSNISFIDSKDFAYCFEGTEEANSFIKEFCLKDCIVDNK